jgi:hypothetical protein
LGFASAPEAVAEGMTPLDPRKFPSLCK